MSIKRLWHASVPFYVHLHLLSFILLAFCEEEKKLLFLYVIFLHKCTYLTFDLTVTFNRTITLGIHPYIVCDSPGNTSNQDAEH